MSATLLFNQSIKLVHEIQGFISQIQQNLNDQQLYSMTSASLDRLNQSLKDLQDFAKREVTETKREIAHSRANKIKEELQTLKLEFEKLKSQQKERAEQELKDARVALLGTEQTSRQRATLQTPSNPEATVLLLDDFLAKESHVLNHSGDRIEEFIHVGKNALKDLYEQRSMLKSTQKRLLDAANTLGLSTTVIRFIEQRTQADRLILWGGIICIVLFMIAFVYYFG